jgi:hypothetical protein
MVVAMGAILTPRGALAESSKLHKVDLDVSGTTIVRAELGQFGWYYWMDATACVCWVGGKTGSDQYSTASMFDCQKLKAHPAMAEYVSECGNAKEPAKEAPKSEASKEEHKP